MVTAPMVAPPPTAPGAPECGTRPTPLRYSIWLACWALTLTLRGLVVTSGIIGRIRRRPPAYRTTRILLVGMFEADSWLQAHVRPIAESQFCEDIWIVTDRAMAPLPKVTYVCPPPWSQKVFGRAGARSLLCLLVALRRRPDVVGGFHLLLNGMIALIGGRLARAHTMYFCVGGWNEICGGGARSEHKLFRRLGRDCPGLERQLLWFARRIDLTVTMGTGAATFFRRHGYAGRLEILSGGIDHDRFRGAHGSSAEASDLLFVGRLVPVKRVDVLLQAAAIVIRARPETTLTLIGDGPLRTNLERQTDQLGISRAVTFLGHRNDVAHWLARARILMLTSDSEGLPLVVMEAMTAGLPVVVSDVGDVADLVEDGVNGYRVVPGDADEFARRALELLDDDPRYDRFARGARTAARRYALTAMIERWDDLLPRLRATDGQLLGHET